VAIAACDLAEVLGMAIGINLLFGIPLIEGVMIVLDTFFYYCFLSTRDSKNGAFIIALVMVVGVSFIFEMIFACNRHGRVIRFNSFYTNETALYTLQLVSLEQPLSTTQFIPSFLFGAYQTENLTELQRN
jgi:manganese transport protein